MTKKASVYRAYDIEGRLMYVGSTKDFDLRVRQHQRKTFWWQSVARVVPRYYETARRARLVEKRAISILKPLYNVLGHPDQARRLSERFSGQGRAAQQAAGRRFGRSKAIQDSPTRIEFLRQLDRDGALRKPNGKLIPKAVDLTAELNKPKNMGPKDARITNPETVRRWQREGFQGLSSRQT